jgi:DNA-binding CsgD family transcriptional regulator
MQVAGSGADARTLRLKLIEVLRAAVPFDDYAWLLTDPETAVGCAPLADVRCLPELPTLIRLRYQTELNRWTHLDEAPAASLSAATEGNLERSLVWRELLDRHGVGDVASVVFRDQFGCWGFLELWRSNTQRAFDAAEIQFLSQLAPAVTAGLRGGQALTFIEPPAAEQLGGGPAVLMLSCTLDVLAQTPETEQYLRGLVPPPDGTQPVPSGAYNVAAQLLAVEAGVDTHQPSARVHMSDGVWLTMRAARMGDAEPLSGRNIAVTIEKTSPAARVDLFSRAFGLSPRESELFSHVIAGADTKEIARRMYLSEHTIQDHLKSIFSKTSSRSRRELVSRALGT